MLFIHKFNAYMTERIVVFYHTLETIIFKPSQSQKYAINLRKLSDHKQLQFRRVLKHVLKNKGL